MGPKRTPLSVKVSAGIVAIQTARFVGLLVFAAAVTGGPCQAPCPLQGYDGLVIPQLFIVAGLTDVVVAAMAVRIVVPFYRGQRGYRKWAFVFAGVAAGDSAFATVLTIVSEVHAAGVGTSIGFGLVVATNLVLLGLLSTRSAKEFFVQE